MSCFHGNALYAFPNPNGFPKRLPPPTTPSRLLVNHIYVPSVFRLDFRLQESYVGSLWSTQLVSRVSCPVSLDGIEVAARVSIYSVAGWTKPLEFRCSIVGEIRETTSRLMCYRVILKACKRTISISNKRTYDVVKSSWCDKVHSWCGIYCTIYMFRGNIIKRWTPCIYIYIVALGLVNWLMCLIELCLLWDFALEWPKEKYMAVV